MAALLLLLAVWFSGVAALAAEVAWFRGLGRGVGTSAEALAVVSAAFLGGLGLGAAIASRLCRKARFPFRSAARCEMLAGLFVFLSPYAIALVPGAHVALLEALGLEPGRSSWPAALVALPILLIPTAFLGATLPFLVRGILTSGVERAGRWTGALYGVNTFGALCGTAASVLFLLPRLGEITSLRVASGCNLLAAALILFVERPKARQVVDEASSATSDVQVEDALAGALEQSASLPPPPPVQAPGRALPALTRSPVSIPEMALFASGLFALGAEVAWFRLLEPLIGIHVFGFAILLGAVLAGTALGGAIGGWIADRVRRPDLTLTTVLAVAGLLTVASIWGAGLVPWLSMRAATSAAESAKEAQHATAEVGRIAASAMLWARLASVALCVALPMCAFAMAYPLAVRVRALDPARAASAVGSTYAWNTAGNVLGSLLAGFLLLPAIGSPRTLAAFGGLALASAAALRLFAARPRPVWPALIPLVGVGLLSLPGSGAKLDAAGPSLPDVVAIDKWSEGYVIRSKADASAFAEMLGGTYPRPVGRDDLPAVLPREGVVSSVGVLLEGKVIRLRQGGLSEAKINPNYPDAGSETEVALALVPYLAHPNPKTALVIGHGGGWSAETAISTPMQVDVAELEAAVLDVVEAVRGPLLVRNASNAKLHVTDGRLLLRKAARRANGERYDVIVSQPSHPWVPGAGSLFTKEAYALARSALNEGGVFSQWLNIFSMSHELLQTALKAWYEVFPDCWVMVYSDELVLVGFTREGTIDVPRWERELASGAIGVRANAAGINEPADLVRRIAFDGTGLVRILPVDRATASDDDPRLELGLAWNRFTGVDTEASKKQIYEDLRSVFPPRFEKIVPDPGQRDALLAACVWSLLESNQPEEARRWLRTGGPSLAFDGGTLGKRARARESLVTAKASSTNAAQRTTLARRGVDLLRAAVAQAPDDPEPANELGLALIDQDRLVEAIDDMADASKRFPGDGRILSLWGQALITMNRAPEAEAAFGRALKAKGHAAPAGTGMMHARTLDTMEPRRPKDARDALRSDPSTMDDLEALKKLHELEIELGYSGVSGVPPAALELEARLAELERRKGFEALETALAGVFSRTKDPLVEAREATRLLPKEIRAWRVRGWLELRSRIADSAAESFRNALALAADPEAERARFVSWYRLMGRDPAEMDVEPKK